jgi:hypothetical protein
MDSCLLRCETFKNRVCLDASESFPKQADAKYTYAGWKQQGITTGTGLWCTPSITLERTFVTYRTVVANLKAKVSRLPGLVYSLLAASGQY